MSSHLELQIITTRKFLSIAMENLSMLMPLFNHESNHRSSTNNNHRNIWEKTIFWYMNSTQGSIQVHRHKIFFSPNVLQMRTFLSNWLNYEPILTKIFSFRRKKGLFWFLLVRRLHFCQNKDPSMYPAPTCKTPM